MAKRSYQRIRCGIDLVLPPHAEADAADDEKGPEYVKHPMKTGDQTYPSTNKDAAQYKRPDDAPK